MTVKRSLNELETRRTYHAGASGHWRTKQDLCADTGKGGRCPCLIPQSWKSSTGSCAILLTLPLEKLLKKIPLLNCISTIDSVSSGHIYLGEQDLTTISSAKMAAFRRENLGFIFQDFNLLEPLTIEENISLPLSIKGIPGKEIEKIVKRLMQRLNISDIAGKLPAHVSGGQKQRCACARAFVNNPKLILADEPTGALDSASAKQLLSMLAELNEQDRSTILMVTHDPFSASFGNRVLFIKDGNLKKEIDKGQHNRNDFYQTILSEISAFGGE